MCGITGIINYNKSIIQESVLLGMMGAMKHRGPDDEGLFIDETIGLGFVRLSILDLSDTGHQPMISENNRYVIVFNGEVYNYLELKQELGSKYHFRGLSDTEVVLTAYIEWGEDCLNKFNGMFAFAIYDKENKTFFAARDRFGIKPFYYHNNYRHFIFASDIQPILSFPDFYPNVNDGVVFNYLLTNRTNYSAETFITDIKKLSPGHKLKIIKNELIIEKWYDIENHILIDGFKTSDDYTKAFNDAIKLQLRSDVPIGVCLSGGLDSSAITSTILKKFNLKLLHTYSAIYNEGDKGDEQTYISLLKSERLDMHYTKPTYLDLLKDIDKYVTAMGEPIPGTSEYAEFKVMQLAQKNSKVILNGQGADEVLGGYDYFYSAYLKELIYKLKFISILREFTFLLKHKKLIVNLKYLIFYKIPVIMQCFILKKRNNIFNDKYYKRNLNEAKDLIRRFYKFKDTKSFFKNHLKYKFEHHLMWADKSGMYFSIETRFPFIDHNLIEKTLSTDLNMILNKGWTKKILRESLLNTLDEKIRLRKDKIGFETPEGNWFKEKKFQEFLWDIINSKSFNERPYFNAVKVKKLYSDHLKSKKDYSNVIWKTIHLELWLRKYVDTKKIIGSNNKIAIITPVKNEADYIHKTIESVINQKTLPEIWVIVDDGSTDNTLEIIHNCVKNYNWIKVISVANKNEKKSGGSKVVRAFYKGLEEINENNYDYIVKLDGDLILPEDYFTKMLNAFGADKKLGICGGMIYNKFSETDLRKEKVSPFHVRGALKMIRIECWKNINGFKEIWNWDGLDIMEAQYYGWKTKSINVPVVHLKPTTSSYDPIEHSFKSGYEAYKMGATYTLTLMRAIVKNKNKLFLKSSIAYLNGYKMAKKNKEALIIKKSLAEFINKKHYSRLIPIKNYEH